MNRLAVNPPESGRSGWFKEPIPWHASCFMSSVAGLDRSMPERRLSAAARLLPAVLLAALVVFAGGVSLVRTIAGFQPLGLAVEPQEGSWLVTETAPGSELAVGDRILQVDGEGYGLVGDLEEALRRRPTSELLVLRDGGLVELGHTLPPLAIDWAYLVLALIGAIYLGIGLYTLLRDRRRPAHLFFLWCLASALVYVVLSSRGPFDLTGKGLYLFEEVARVLLAPLTLHLFTVFPSVSRRLRPAVPFFYLPAAFLLLMQADLVIANGRWLFGGQIAGALTMLDRLELFHLVIFGLAAAAVLAWRLRRGKRQAASHRQATWIAVGMVGGYVPFALLYLLPLTFGLMPPQPLTALAVVPLALVPLTFAYAILRYKLWDIGVLVRETASLSLTVLVGVIGFSLANLTINRILPDETALARNLLSFVSGLAIAGMLLPVRRGVSSSLERIQYGSRFGRRRSLAQAGRELLELRDLDQLCTTLIEGLESVLEVRPANLLLLHGGSLVPLAHRASPAEPIVAEKVPEEVWQAEVAGLSGVELPGGESSPMQRLFAAGYRYAFPMSLRSKRIGLLVTGYKEDDVPLSSDDVDLVRNLLNQATLAIENAELLDEVHRRLAEVVRLQRFSQRIFDSSPAGIVVIDGDGTVLSANRAFAHVAGSEAVAGRPLAEVLPITPLPTPEEGIRELSFEGGEEGRRHLQVSVAPLQAGGEDDRQVVLVQDISQQVAMADELRAKDRMASLGMLAAGVAHEVNTPITGISSYAQMLLAHTPESDPRHELLKKVEKQTFRAARIVNNLLELARDRHGERSPVAMVPLVEECLDLLVERIEERNLTLHWQPPADPAAMQVMGIDGELQQVLTNLVINAIEAMTPAGSGTLTVSLSSSQRWVWLTVEDTGPGMSADQLERLFQPFFSTKQDRGGTGLGLAISHNLVRRHEGDIRVISHPGEGSRFVVELPRHHPRGEGA
jgi:PAS domain S-box-containing protein